MFRRSFLRGLFFGSLIGTAASITFVSKKNPEFRAKMTKMLNNLGKSAKTSLGQAISKISDLAGKAADMQDTSSTQTRGQLRAVVEGSRGIINYTERHMKKGISRLRRISK